MPGIHPTAIVAAGASFGAGVEIGAYSVVGAGVSVGEGTTIGSHVLIAGQTTIGRNNRLFPFSSIGDIPQDKKYDGAVTRTVIGDENVIREFVSINAGTAQDRGVTTIGNGNWLLAYSHIAHDCVVGNGTTFSNNAQLAGHVLVEDYAVLGGFVGVHQFCRVGAHAMVAAGFVLAPGAPPVLAPAGASPKPRGGHHAGPRPPGLSAPPIPPAQSARIGACIAAGSRSTMRSRRSPPRRRQFRPWSLSSRSWNIPVEGSSVDGADDCGRACLDAGDHRHRRRRSIRRRVGGGIDRCG